MKAISFDVDIAIASTSSGWSRKEDTRTSRAEQANKTQARLGRTRAHPAPTNMTQRRNLQYDDEQILHMSLQSHHPWSLQLTVWQNKHSGTGAERQRGVLFADATGRAALVYIRV